MKKTDLNFTTRNISNIGLFLSIIFIAMLSISSCKPEPTPTPKAKEKKYCYLEGGVEVCYENPK